MNNTPAIITQAAPTLVEQMQYADTISGAALLPQAYRGKPADILIATGLGQAIGISPAQALYEIYVVNGRPSPSANLMAALVRRAGHKLRVQGDATTCTATLIRADDPDFPFTATWTIEQARAANLTSKGGPWTQFPGAMLRARAVSEVVRMGAPEAVLGMEYAKEEMQDVEPDNAPKPLKPQGMGALRAAVKPQPTPEPVADEVTGEVVDDDKASRSQLNAMFAAFGDLPYDMPDGRTPEGREARLGYCSKVIGREVSTSKDLTRDEASAIIDALRAESADPFAATDEAGA